MESWSSPKLKYELQQLSVSGEPPGKEHNISSSASLRGPESEVPVPIYSSTAPYDKYQLMQTAKQNKEGVRKITEKYDSVDKLRSSVARDRLGDSNSYGGYKPSESSGLTTESPTANPVRHRPGGNQFSENLQESSRTPGVARMSDGASDISDPNPSSLSTTSTQSNPADSLSEQDLLQVEMFFRSHKSDVHVCQCLANLYFASGCEKKTGKQNWQFSVTGIPLLVLDTGEHHRKRRLQFVMAEKGTGFVLFKDVIDHLTKYSAPHSNFHTLHISTDHNKQAGLSFDDTAAAADFHRYLMSLINNPDDDLLNLSKKKKKKDPNKAKLKKYKAPKKAEISQPCCFVHVTKLERPQISELSDGYVGQVDGRSLGSSETLEDLSS